MERKILLSFLVTIISYQTSASCFGKDASWETNSKPTITQPSKNDPEKVLVTWGNIIKNVNCVDKFFVWVWPDGTAKTGPSARKIEVDKTKISVIVDVDACLGYRFALESEEDDFRKNFHSTSEVLFKTQAVPSITKLDKTKFTVGYHWDPIRHVSDLKLASIIFPKNLVNHANCLDYIQVTGSEVRGKPNLSRHSSTASMTGKVAWGHLGQQRQTFRSWSSPGRSSGSGFNPGSSSGGSGFNSGSSSGSGFNSGRSSPSPSISSGIASTLPASVSRGSSPPRGPLAGTYSSSVSSLPTGNSPFGPIENPTYANTLPRANTKGATKQVGPVKTQPPFLNSSIELLITAPDCAEFNFEVKMFSSRKEIGKVQVHLPALADIPSYIPPPITDVMSISFGSNGKPIYGVKTSSGVSAACLPAYFEASDAYRQRLENEIGYFAGLTDSSNNEVSNTVDKSDKLDEETLKRHGCLCFSSNLKFSSTDPKIEKEHPEFFGTYSYKGMHENHPSYQKTGAKVIYLFFNKAKTQWVFGPTLGSTKNSEYASAELSTAKCPGDPANVGQWMRKTSFLHRWQKEKTLKLLCMK